MKTENGNYETKVLSNRFVYLIILSIYYLYIFKSFIPKSCPKTKMVCSCYDKLQINK